MMLPISRFPQEGSVFSAPVQLMCLRIIHVSITTLFVLLNAGVRILFNISSRQAPSYLESSICWTAFNTDLALILRDKVCTHCSRYDFANNRAHGESPHYTYCNKHAIFPPVILIIFSNDVRAFYVSCARSLNPAAFCDLSPFIHIILYVSILDPGTLYHSDHLDSMHSLTSWSLI